MRHQQRRKRASVLIYDSSTKRVLLMYRFEKNIEKYVIPGGGVEAGESFRRAAVREIREETNLHIEIDRELITRRTANCTEVVFLATRFSGKLGLFGEELERINAKNIYRPEWVGIHDLIGGVIPVYPKVVVRALIRHIRALEQE